MVGPSLVDRVGGGAADAAKDIEMSKSATVHTVPVRSLFSGVVGCIMGTRVLNTLVGGARYCSLLGVSLLLFGGAAPGGGVPPGSDDAGAVSSKSLVA
jgi:hypothetical protein